MEVGTGQRGYKGNIQEQKMGLACGETGRRSLWLDSRRRGPAEEGVTGLGRSQGMGRRDLGKLLEGVLFSC